MQVHLGHKLINQAARGVAAHHVHVTQITEQVLLNDFMLTVEERKKNWTESVWKHEVYATRKLHLNQISSIQDRDTVWVEE